MSDKPVHQYIVRKIITRVEEVVVEAPSSNHVQQMLLSNGVAFGGVSSERMKRITFEVERKDEENPIQTYRT